MELFEIEIHRQELIERIKQETALDDVKKITLLGVVEKTQDTKTLGAIFQFMNDIDMLRLDVTKQVVQEERTVYDVKVKNLLKQIESDYHKVQQEELLRLMSELS